MSKYCPNCGMRYETLNEYLASFYKPSDKVLTDYILLSMPFVNILMWCIIIQSYYDNRKIVKIKKVNKK